LVAIPVLKAVPEPVIVILPVPKAIDLPEEFEEAYERHVKVEFPKSNVPELCVTAPVVVNAPLNVRVKDPADTIIGADIVTPLVVVVPVPVNDIAPVADQVVVVDKVKLPTHVKVPVDVNVHVAPVVVMLRQANAPVIVIVGLPLLPFTITSSAFVGTEAPLAPPEVADQCVVVVESQVPVPPTQYLLAIICP
jgi:hypothetical protein